MTPDALDAESADQILDGLRLGRAAVLVPRPIAAAWAWRELYKDASRAAKQGDIRQPRRLETVQLSEREWTRVSIQLLKATDGRLVPARDHIADTARSGQWHAGIGGLDGDDLVNARDLPILLAA